MSLQEYSGKELELFRHAVNWKKYFSKKLIPHIHGDVLEVGAGIGETTPYLYNDSVSSWTSLEPDNNLFEQLRQKSLPAINAMNGNLRDLHPSMQFDCILYIDVLEHIADDKEEMKRASRHLRPGGKLIVLSPAHQFLFNEFDRQIGHCRRYNRKTLRDVFINKGLKEQRMFYLESAGMPLLLVNKLFFRKKYPTLNTIHFWDKYLIPVSRLTDRLLNYSTGKTIVGIWQK